MDRRVREGDEEQVNPFAVFRDSGLHVAAGLVLTLACASSQPPPTDPSQPPSQTEQSQQQSSQSSEAQSQSGEQGQQSSQTQSNSQGQQQGEESRDGANTPHPKSTCQKNT
jgi:hypothetical protein